MSNLALRSIARQVRDLNVAKRGATSLYVDGTNGSDNNTGESWRQALATIQEAVDVADDWTNIFIKAGAYAESVRIDGKHNISLIGASRAGVHITAPNIGNAYSSSAVVFTNSLNGHIANLKLTAGGTYNGAYFVDSDLGMIENCYFYDCECAIRLWNASDTIVQNNVIDGNNRNVSLPGGGIYMDTDSLRCKAHSNTISNYTGFGWGIGITGDNCQFYDNTIESVYNGIYAYSTLKNTSIFHNNLISCSNAYIRDDSANADVFENYYSAHTNVDNGFGIAKTPYAYTGGADPRPICMRNGWLGLSWADADQVADILANQRKSWSWNALESTYTAIEGTWATDTDSGTHLGKYLYNTPAINDEIAIAFFAFSTSAVTLNCRCNTGNSKGIMTVYVDGVSQDAIDMYSASGVTNVIKTISITPARAGLNVLRLKLTGKNASSSNYAINLMELWLS